MQEILKATEGILLKPSLKLFYIDDICNGYMYFNSCLSRHVLQQTREFAPGGRVDDSNKYKFKILAVMLKEEDKIARELQVSLLQ